MVIWPFSAPWTSKTLIRNRLISVPGFENSLWELKAAKNTAKESGGRREQRYYRQFRDGLHHKIDLIFKIHWAGRADVRMSLWEGQERNLSVWINGKVEKWKKSGGTEGTGEFKMIMKRSVRKEERVEQWTSEWTCRKITKRGGTSGTNMSK